MIEISGDFDDRASEDTRSGRTSGAPGGHGEAAGERSAGFEAG